MPSLDHTSTQIHLPEILQKTTSLALGAGSFVITGQDVTLSIQRAAPASGTSGEAMPPPIRQTTVIFQGAGRHAVVVRGGGTIRQEVPVHGRSRVLVSGSGRARTRLRLVGAGAVALEGAGLASTRLHGVGANCVTLSGSGAADLIDWPTIWREEEELVMLLILSEDLVAA